MTGNGDILLRVEHLTMRFGGLVAVDDLSFEARQGNITALIGPNGAGKTTVFNCITGFYKPSEGRIGLRHGDRPSCGANWKRSPTAASAASRARDGALYQLERMPEFLVTQQARVARTFQNIRLFPGMTVLENLLVAQHNRLMLASGYTLFGILGFPSYAAAERAAIDKARDWLDRIGLLARADDPAGDLPYGAQRRLEIARAMCTEPVLLCLDEPAAGLNPRESAELNALLLAIRDEHAISILLIEHDMSVVMEISDHVVVLDYGVKIADGDAGGGAQRSEGDRRLSRRRRRGRGEGRSGGRAMTSPLLSVRGVKTFYGRVMALKGVDLDVNDGEIVTLIGANGAGKSTLMMTICGNPRAREGTHRLRRPRHHPAADARDRAAQAGAGAGRPPHLLAHDGAGKSADGRHHRRAVRIRRAISSACSTLFPRLQAAHRASAAARCRAASSRCWRSRAR